MLMNRLGVSRQEAETWALSYNLGEKETLNIVRSCYRYTEQFGSFEFRPSRGTRSYNTRVPQVEAGAGAGAKGEPSAREPYYMENVKNNPSTANNLGTTATTNDDQDTMQMKVPKGIDNYAWPFFLQ